MRFVVLAFPHDTAVQISCLHTQKVSVIGHGYIITFLYSNPIIASSQCIKVKSPCFYDMGVGRHTSLRCGAYWRKDLRSGAQHAAVFENMIIKMMSPTQPNCLQVTAAITAQANFTKPLCPKALISRVRGVPLKNLGCLVCASSAALKLNNNQKALREHTPPPRLYNYFNCRFQQSITENVIYADLHQNTHSVIQLCVRCKP